MAAKKAEAKAPKTYVLRAYIQGLRDGEKWPLPGETIELTDAEAADYLVMGYIRPQTDEEIESRPAPAPPETAVIPDPKAPTGLTTATVLGTTAVPAVEGSPTTADAALSAPVEAVADNAVPTTSKPTGTPKVAGK